MTPVPPMAVLSGAGFGGRPPDLTPCGHLPTPAMVLDRPIRHVRGSTVATPV
jgi:hypothetical protein